MMCFGYAFTSGLQQLWATNSARTWSRCCKHSWPLIVRSVACLDLFKIKGPPYPHHPGWSDWSERKRRPQIVSWSGTECAAGLSEGGTARWGSIVTTRCGVAAPLPRLSPTALHRLTVPAALHCLTVPTALYRLTATTALQRLPAPTALHRLPAPTALHRLPVSTALHRLPAPTTLHRLTVPTAVRRLPAPSALHRLTPPTALPRLTGHTQHQVTTLLLRTFQGKLFISFLC